MASGATTHTWMPRERPTDSPRAASSRLLLGAFLRGGGRAGAIRHFRGVPRGLKRTALALADVPIFGQAAFASYLTRRYGAGVVTPEKVRNFVAVQRDLQARAVTVRSRPYLVNLDTLNVCRLKCPFCATGTRQLDRKQRQLGFELSCKVIDAVKPFALKVQLYGWGEPLLDPDIFRITRYAADAGLYTIIHSPLSEERPGLAEEIVESKLDLLNVSLDGLSQATLERYRRGASFELARRNVAAIVEERQRRRSATPRILIAFHVFRHNEHEIAELADLKREWGVDAVLPRRSFIFDPDWVPERADFAAQEAPFDGTCQFLYTDLTVEADGTLSPCDTNTSVRYSLGTIADLQDFERFWNSPTHRAMRAFYAGYSQQQVRELNRGESILCEHCGFVAGHGPSTAPLSPAPPSMRARGESYRFD